MEGQREKYVKELRKYNDVDIFGDCGPHNGPKSDMSHCMEVPPLSGLRELAVSAVRHRKVLHVVPGRHRGSSCRPRGS